MVSSMSPVISDNKRDWMWWALNHDEISDSASRQHKSINKVSWEANHHIRRISEGSCDTEDWQICFAITETN